MPVNDVSDVLHYLHSVLEGRNGNVNRWLTQNKEVLKTLFSGPEMARLKFTPIEFARKLLAKHSVAFGENEARTRRETFLLGYADECLDDLVNSAPITMGGFLTACCVIFWRATSQQGGNAFCGFCRRTKPGRATARRAGAGSAVFRRIRTALPSRMVGCHCVGNEGVL